MAKILQDMQLPFLRTPYNYDRNKAGDESGLHCTEPTLAKQSFKEECDINTIVERFHLTGELPTNVRMPTFGDFTGISDYHTAMNAIAQANEAFDRMPANVRARFHNDPAEFVAFCDNPDNTDEAKRLGLVEAKALEAATALAGPQDLPKGPADTPKPNPEPAKAPEPAKN